jgi:hypothetical protein
MDHGTISIRRLDDPAEILELRGPYADLFESQPSAHIATSFAYLLANAQVRRRDEDWHIFAAFDGAKLVGCLFGCRSLRSVLGVTLPVFDVGTEFVSDPLVCDEGGRNILGLLVDATLRDQSDCVLFNFERLTPPSFDALHACLSRNRRFVSGWSPYGLRIDTSCSPEHLMSRMGKKRRQDLGRRHRRLSEKYAVDFSVERSRGRERNSCRFAQFLALENSGWKGREGTSISSRPGNEDYFRKIVEAATDAGQMTWCTLRADGKPIAMQFCLRSHGQLWMPKVAYDEDFAHYGPGMMATHLMLLELCNDSGVSSLNNIGGAPWIEAWRPSRLLHRSITLFSETRRAFALFLGLKARDACFRTLFGREPRVESKDRPFLRNTVPA